MLSSVLLARAVSFAWGPWSWPVFASTSLPDTLLEWSWNVFARGKELFFSFQEHYWNWEICTEVENEERIIRGCVLFVEIDEVFSEIIFIESRLFFTKIVLTSQWTVQNYYETCGLWLWKFYGEMVGVARARHIWLNNYSCQDQIRLRIVMFSSIWVLM